MKKLPEWKEFIKDYLDNTLPSWTFVSKEINLPAQAFFHHPTLGNENVLVEILDKDPEPQIFIEGVTIEKTPNNELGWLQFPDGEVIPLDVDSIFILKKKLSSYLTKKGEKGDVAA